MRWLAIAALALSSCAQDIVAVDHDDAAEPVTHDDARTGNLDATMAGLPDATANASNCSRRMQDNILVPDQTGMNRLTGIRSMRFGPNRQLYVLSREGPPYHSWVTVLGPAPNHALIRSFGHAKLGAAQDLVVDSGGNVSVVEYDLNGGADPVVHVFDPNGTFIRTWTANGGGQDEARSMALDTQGRIYIGGLVVFRYDPQGNFIDSMGAWGSAPGRIGLARGLAFDSRGFVWVADFVRNKVHQFDISSRSQVTEFGSRGPGPGQFDGNEDPMVVWGPSQLDLDASGAIYANDPFVSRVQKLSRQGGFLGEMSMGGTMNVGPVRVEPMNGNVYVGIDTAVAIMCPL